MSAATRSSSMWQPAGRNGKPASIWSIRSFRLPPRRARKRRSKRNSRAVAPDEVEDRAHRLPRGTPQAASQLLEEEGRAVRGAQEEEGVDDGQVDALVEQVDREDDIHPACREIRQSGSALLVRAVGPDGNRADARLVEQPRHVARVLDAHAESERPHPTCVIDARGELRGGPVRAQASVAVSRFDRPCRVVSATPLPGDLAQVQAVVDAVVGERREAVLGDRVPEAKLGGDPVVEPAEDRQAVAPLGSGGEAEELDGLHAARAGPGRSGRPRGGTRRR